MTDKKTTKTEKQAEAKKSVELKEEDLDTVEGGAGVGARERRAVVKPPSGEVFITSNEDHF